MKVSVKDLQVTMEINHPAASSGVLIRTRQADDLRVVFDRFYPDF